MTDAELAHEEALTRTIVRQLDRANINVVPLSPEEERRWRAGRGIDWHAKAQQ